MYTSQEEIKSRIDKMIIRNKEKTASLKQEACICRYAELVCDGIWSNALQKALDENEIVRIPAKDEPYLIDKTITIPSNRHIIAEDGAIIRQAEGVRVLMLRNEHTKDGTHIPIDTSDRDCNITITGGRWEESWRTRLGYGRTGMYVQDRSEFFGVSTLMLFTNISGLTLENMTFAHTAGFSVQAGDADDMVFENIEFVSCYADGLHLNGNIENVYVKNVRGQVGDDLVALNTYDWQNSSVNFGPGKTIWCEDLELSADSPYKAFRLQPAIYKYDDGSTVDCALIDVVIKNVVGILTYKMYMQTPGYVVNVNKPEWGAIGSMDNIYFENINVDLNKPLDGMAVYRNHDPVRGAFAAFEINANIGNIQFKNVNIQMYRDKWPMSYAVTFGPKSAVADCEKGVYETFDPYLSSVVEHLVLDNLTVNDIKVTQAEEYIKAVVFEDINGDGFSTGKGEIKKITVK